MYRLCCYTVATQTELAIEGSVFCNTSHFESCVCGDSYLIYSSMIVVYFKMNVLLKTMWIAALMYQ